MPYFESAKPDYLYLRYVIPGIFAFNFLSLIGERKFNQIPPKDGYKDLPMEPSKEKRRYQRYSHKSPIDFYRMDYKNNRHSAEMIDYCYHGLSLMTNKKLVLGESVYVELTNRDTHIKPSIKGLNCSGIVRWGKRYPLTNAATKNIYKYGIEFSTNVNF